MNKTTLLSLLIISLSLSAQTVSGTIVSKEDRYPIPYAKIGIENQNFGAIADAQGKYTINLNEIDPNSTLQIEISGYEKYKVSVKDFTTATQQQIWLTEKVKDIEEVKINPQKFVQKNWGVNTKTNRVLIGHIPGKQLESDQSKEIAVLFKNNRKTKIEKIHINIATYKSDQPVFIRFTVYDKNLNSILKEDITDEITTDKIIEGTYSFDLTKYNIWSVDDFYVGIQLLNRFEGALYMSAALLGNKTIYRKYLGLWENIPVVSPAINIDVKVAKK